MMRSQRSVGWFARVSVLSLAAMLVAASWCSAQEGRRGGRGPGFGRGAGFGAFGAGPAALIGNEQVQSALNLTSDQRALIEELQRTTREASRDRFAELRDLSPEQRRERGRELMEAQAAEFEAALNDVLNEEQQARFQQIRLQVRGHQALLDDEVAGKLELTDEQKGQIREALDTQAARRRELFQELGRGERDRARFTELREKGEEIQKETDAKVAEVLTSEQKAAWAELTGPTVEISVPRGGFQRGQGRGGFQRGEGGRRGDGPRRRPGGRRQPQ